MKKQMVKLSGSPKLTRRELLTLGVGFSVLNLAGASVALASDTLLATPSQSEGPFFPNGKQPDHDADLTQVSGRAGRAKGEVIQVSGRVLSPNQQPIEGVLITVWQANAAGRYAHQADRNPAPLDENFQGWGQMMTDANGEYRFTTIMPGPYPASGSWSRPPHIHFKLSKRNYRDLTTQMYFSGHPLNAADRLLQQVDPEVRKQLIVEFMTVADGADQPTRAGEFNIVLEEERA